jgi:hypothetical protein
VRQLALRDRRRGVRITYKRQHRNQMSQLPGGDTCVTAE